MAELRTGFDDGDDASEGEYGGGELAVGESVVKRGSPPGHPCLASRLVVFRHDFPGGDGIGKITGCQDEKNPGKKEI